MASRVWGTSTGNPPPTLTADTLLVNRRLRAESGCRPALVGFGVVRGLHLWLVLRLCGAQGIALPFLSSYRRQYVNEGDKKLGERWTRVANVALRLDISS